MWPCDLSAVGVERGGLLGLVSWLSSKCRKRLHIKGMGLDVSNQDASVLFGSLCIHKCTPLTSTQVSVHAHTKDEEQ